MSFEIENGVLERYIEEPSVTEVIIPDSVTRIGYRAFEDCSSLTTVTIPESVTSIGDSAFYGCESLTSVTIPDSVTSIGAEAFYECKSLTSVTIPNSVTSIGNWTFSGCESLTSVTIGKGLKSVDNIPFNHLEEIVVSPDNMHLMSIDNVVYDKTGTKLIRCVGKKTGEFTIPDSVTSIGVWAFEYCRSLTSVIIGDSVTNIGESAFRYCTSLTSVTIPDSVTSIGYEVFYECTSLTAVTIPDSVTSIGGYAFSRCTSLTAVTIGSSVKSIGNFAFKGCTSLTAVIIPDSVMDIVGDTFWGYKKIKRLPAFGYIVDGTQLNFEKVAASEVKTMLETKDYSVRMDHPTKYQFAAQVFLKDGQPEAEAYIKKNISKILPYFIDIGDYETVKGLLESGKFVTKRNILKFVDYAIENTQKGGDMQIQVLIMIYRNEHFHDIDPLKSFKL